MEKSEIIKELSKTRETLNHIFNEAEFALETEDSASDSDEYHRISLLIYKMRRASNRLNEINESMIK